MKITGESEPQASTVSEPFAAVKLVSETIVLIENVTEDEIKERDAEIARVQCEKGRERTEKNRKKAVELRTDQLQATVVAVTAMAEAAGVAYEKIQASKNFPRVAVAAAKAIALAGKICAS